MNLLISKEITQVYELDHSQHQNQARAAAANEEDIFCSTMKTGQLCTHGTAVTLGVSGESNEKWVAIARKEQYLARLLSEEREEGKASWKPLKLGEDVGVWTDDYSNIWSVFMR